LNEVKKGKKRKERENKKRKRMIIEGRK